MGCCCAKGVAASTGKKPASIKAAAHPPPGAAEGVSPLASAPPPPPALTEQALRPAAAAGGMQQQHQGWPGRFQILLAGEWRNYTRKEDQILTQAYLIGQQHARYALRGHTYEYNFRNMKQVNLKTGKERNIRPPHGMVAPPAPLLPTGPVVVVTVPAGAAGQTIEVNDPNNEGRRILVSVPPEARTGQQMAVPVPEPGESVEAVQDKQAKHSKGAKLAMGLAGAGALAGVGVAGVVLGDHLAGGDMAADIGGHVAGAAEAVADWVPGAAEDAGAWLEGAAVDAGDWLGGAVGDAGDWMEGAAEDTAHWVEGAVPDAIQWVEHVGEDMAEFVINLF